MNHLNEKGMLSSSRMMSENKTGVLAWQDPCIIWKGHSPNLTKGTTHSKTVRVNLELGEILGNVVMFNKYLTDVIWTLGCGDCLGKAWPVHCTAP